MSDRPCTTWRVVLGGEAERDFARIIAWTAETFGPRQAASYGEHLNALLSALCAGPEPHGFRPRDDVGEGFCTLHVRSLGRRGRHFALYRAAGSEIQVVRILHDSMDTARHAPHDEGDS